MSTDIVQLYGPGMSFYRVPAKAASDNTAAKPSDLSLEKYSATLKALYNSNQKLQIKMNKLCSNTVRLELDSMKLQRHIRSFYSDMLVTWQADTLTRLVEVVYERHGWKLPGDIEVGDYEDLDRGTLSTLFSVAARKIKRDALQRRFGLSLQYYMALQKYDEIVHFRSTNPFRTECTFARFLVSGREKHMSLYQFWGKLYPVCYGRSVEETSEMF